MTVFSNIRELTFASQQMHELVNLRTLQATSSVPIGFELNFKSLGDLIHAPLVVNLFNKFLPSAIITDINVEEEYFDADGLLSLFQNNLVSKSISNIELPNYKIVSIGCYDTMVTAYNCDSIRYDFIFPMETIRPLHFGDAAIAARSEIKYLLGIHDDERVLVISSFSCIHPSEISFEHNNPLIKRDFYLTNEARYLPPEDIVYFIQRILNEGMYDRIILVPRNITEELNHLVTLTNLEKLKIVFEKTTRLKNCWKIIVIAGKGVLRSIYAASDCAVVMGYHNILEPFLINPKIEVWCFKPPSYSPNIDSWKCGNRLGILNTLKACSAKNRCRVIFDGILRGSEAKIFSRKAYLEDTYPNSALKKVKKSIIWLSGLL